MGDFVTDAYNIGRGIHQRCGHTIFYVSVF
jgi:hypothetical protein